MSVKSISVRERCAAAASLVSSCTNSRFLEGLSESELASILRAATERRFLANSVVVNQEDPAGQVFLIKEGVARHFVILESGRKVLLRWLRPGDVFGGRALLLKPSFYLVGTETVHDSRVLLWPRKIMRELFVLYPRLWDNALSLASDYLAWFLAAHLALISEDAHDRLARVLLTLAAGVGHNTCNGLELNITNEELANAANLTLFTVSRVLSEWRRKGALLKSRGKIVLRSSVAAALGSGLIPGGDSSLSAPSLPQ